MPASQALVAGRLPSPSRLPSKERLSQSIAAFEKGLKDTKNNSFYVRFSNLRTRTRPPDLTDVTRLAEEISNDCAQRHGNGWRHYAMRIVPILDRIRQFAPIGDTVTGGAQNMIVSGVWGAVRLALEISVSFLTFFEKVSELLLRVGRFSRLHQDFTVLFPDSEELQDLACEYLAIVVDISTKVVRQAQHSTGRQLRHSFISTFDSEFGPLEEHLKAIDLQIERVTNVLAVQRNQKEHSTTQQLTMQVLSKLSSAAMTRRKRDRETRKHNMLTTLCPNQGDYDLIYRRIRRKGQSNCLFTEAAFERWASSRISDFLWLTGNLGSGKSVVLASAYAHLVVDKLDSSRVGKVVPRQMDGEPFMRLSPSPVTVSSFFCTSSNQSTLDPAVIFGSIAYQVLSSSSMAQFLASYLEKGSLDNIKRDPAACVDLLHLVTPEDWDGYIVLDGLDECRREDVELIIDELQRLVEKREIRVLCSSRVGTVDIKEFEESRPGMQLHVLEMEDIDRSIEVDAYIASSMRKWKDMRTITPQLEGLITKQLRLGWSGMFLWLALQVECITADLRSDVPVVDIITKLPKDLPSAFDRALLRMENQGFGSTVLKLVAAAETPMTVRELYVASNVVPGDLDWDPVAAHPATFLWRHGGNVLDVDEEDEKVRFIHHSVVLHLLGRSTVQEADVFHFSMGKAKEHLASVLVTYLNYPQFERQITTYKETAPVEKSNVPMAVAQSVLPRNAHSVLRHIMGSPRQQDRESAFDIQSLLFEVNQMKSATTQLQVEALLGYAKAQWLPTTQYFLHWPPPVVSKHWNRLVRGEVQIAPTPYIVPLGGGGYRTSTFWAADNGHHAIFCHFLRESNHSGGDSVSIAVGHLGTIVLNGWPILLRGSCLIGVLECWLRVMGWESTDPRRITGNSFCTLIRYAYPPYESFCQFFDEDRQLEDDALTSGAGWLLDELLGLVEREGSASTRDLAKECIGRLARYTNINAPVRDNLTPLQFVITHRCAGYIMPIINAGAALSSDLQARDTLDPFLLACLKGSAQMVETLLDAGASVNTVTADSKRNALAWAMEGVHFGEFEQIVGILAARKIDLKHRDKQGFSALHWAANSGSEDVVRHIIDVARREVRDWRTQSLSDYEVLWVDGQDNDGNTALHVACSKGYTGVQQLLDFEARSDLRNRRGMTPKDMMKQYEAKRRAKGHQVDRQLKKVAAQLYGDD